MSAIPPDVVECTVAPALAERIRGQTEDITHRWLDRVADREGLDPYEVFPTEALLDHVPMLVDAIADFLEDPAEELTAEDTVIAKALELGELRHDQGIRPNEILKEFEILGGILLDVMATEIHTIDPDCHPAQAFICAQRLHRSLAVIERVTTTHYLRLKDERIHEREQRLRGFSRMVSHELKNRVGAVVNAAILLQEEWLPEEKRGPMLEIIADNGRAMADVLTNLLEIARLDPEGTRARDVPLQRVVGEVVRQLREVAKAGGVDVRISSELPRMDVNAAVVELALTNYLSNAIKYCDPDSADRHVEIRAVIGDGDVVPELIIEVEDNGVGVPRADRQHLFEQFFRAPAVTAIEGSGIGLSIVRETIETHGGRVFARFDGQAGGSVFGLGLPLRRREEARTAAAGTQAPGQSQANTAPVISA